jgi:hypothetical protein
MLPFVDRGPELARLRHALRAREGALVCVYGRRRVGKSRLLGELLAGRRAVYYVGDDRDAPLQRRALAREAGRVVPGFDRVEYPDWDALLDRWWSDAPRSVPLVLDELPALVAVSAELPSLLQKRVDRDRRPIVLCGSSQRMMHGLVLDAAAPLYGRAAEILRLGPLDLPWIRPALGLRSPAEAVEHYAVWGGVPRYWDLARPHRSRTAAIRALVLDPQGPLHAEPDRLLRDDLDDLTRSASILALVGQGAHRLSEIASRLGIPATSLTRPIARLMDMGLVERQLPFGRSERDTKRTIYRIADPFLAFWYRFVDPNRSRLVAGQIDDVVASVERGWPQHLGAAWEQIARDSVARVRVAGERWRPASRWWGAGRDGKPLEIDVVAVHDRSPDRILVGEAKLAATAREARALLDDLVRRAARCPALEGKRVEPALWVLRPRGRITDARVLGAGAVVEG